MKNAVGPHRSRSRAALLIALFFVCGVTAAGSIQTSHGFTTPCVIAVFGVSPLCSGGGVGPGLTVTCVSYTISTDSTTTCSAQVVNAEDGSNVITWTQSGTGSISFPSGDTCNLAGTPDDYVCSVTVKGETSGSVSVGASYNPLGTGVVASDSKTVTVTTAVLTSTSTTATCTLAVIDVGQSTTCTATVSGYTGSIDGETITWSQIGGAGDVDASSATCSLSTVSSVTSCSLSVTGDTTGSVTLQASYPGDSSNSGSDGTTALTVDPTLAAGIITTPTPTILLGTSAVLTATWSGGAPDYSVAWYSGSSPICSSDTFFLITDSGLTGSSDMLTVGPLSTTYYCAVITDSASQTVTDAAIQVMVTITSPIASSSMSSTSSSSSSTVSSSSSSSSSTIFTPSPSTSIAISSSSSSSFSSSSSTYSGAPPTSVPQFPIGPLSIVAVVGLMLPVLLLLKKGLGRSRVARSLRKGD